MTSPPTPDAPPSFARPSQSLGLHRVSCPPEIPIGRITGPVLRSPVVSYGEKKNAKPIDVRPFIGYTYNNSMYSRGPILLEVSENRLLFFGRFLEMPLFPSVFEVSLQEDQGGKGTKEV